MAAGVVPQSSCSFRPHAPAGPPPLRSHETLGFTGIPYCHDLSLIIAAAR
jgi:hypothetical protein